MMASNPPPTASRSSSYHTSLDHLPQPSLSQSLSSSSTSSDQASSSSPTIPEPEYATTHHARKGTALVISQPTQVSFVPTSDIQTAVSITADRTVIDTILPPTATLRSRYPRPYSAHAVDQGVREEHRKGFEEELLKKHKEQLYETLKQKWTENYDPTGTIREEIFETLTGVTRFPDPVGTNKSGKAVGKVGCPCICCEMGCSFPLEPLNTVPQQASSSITSKIETKPPTAQVQAEHRTLHSFLDMTETSTRSREGRKRFGFLTLPRRFSRSCSRANLASTASQPGFRATALPVPAPAVPEKVTQQVVPPVANPQVTKSRSFADLVRRRRDKHQTTSVQPSTSTPFLGKGKTRQSLDETSLRLPSRSSSQANLASNYACTSNLANNPPRLGGGRYSLDSTRPLRVDTPLSTPTPPPRRSSKSYAIVSRKPVPALNPNGNATLPRSATYLIGQIVEEEEEDADGVGGSLSRSRRQSALMSSYNPVTDANFETEGRESSSGGRGREWGFRSLGSSGGRYSLDQMRGYDDRRGSQVGLAI